MCSGRGSQKGSDLTDGSPLECSIFTAQGLNEAYAKFKVAATVEGAIQCRDHVLALRANLAKLEASSQGAIHPLSNN